MTQNIYNHDWYALNETRNYPFMSTATLTDESNEPMPSGLIVDMQVVYPDTLQGTPYVAAVSITDYVCTIVVAVGPYSLAVLSVRQPVSAFKIYSLSGLHDGVSGHVVFGMETVHSRGSWRFAAPSQTGLLPSAYLSYAASPISYVVRESDTNKVTGDVLFKPGFDTQITLRGTDTIVFSLEPTSSILKKYLGPCEKYPESGTCGKPGVTSIAGVSPDCSGNITIEVENLYAGWSGSTLVISSDKTLPQVCKPFEVDKYEGEDLCPYPTLAEGVLDFNRVFLAPGNTSGIVWDSNTGITNATPSVPSEVVLPTDLEASKLYFDLQVPVGGQITLSSGSESFIIYDNRLCIGDQEVNFGGVEGNYTIEITATDFKVYGTSGLLGIIECVLPTDSMHMTLLDGYCSQIRYE